MSDKPEVSISSNAMKTADSHEDIQKTFLRSFPALALCNRCNKVGFSRVERACNWINCVSGCFCGPCWSAYMLWKWKDPICCNAKHNCSQCGESLAEYDACK